MLSSFEDAYPSSPHPLPNKKMSFTQKDLEKFKKMTLLDFKSDANRSLADTQESFDKKSITSKNSSSSKKRIQKTKRSKKFELGLSKPFHPFFKCNNSLHELPPSDLSPLKQSKFFLMKQSLDLKKNKQLEKFENCFSPERKSLGNNNTSISPLFTTKKIEKFNLGTIGSTKKSSFEAEFEDQSVASTKYFSKFENDYDVLGVIGRGHYGTVYKCRHKLDKMVYAIKCIKIQYSNFKNLSLSEVNALAIMTVKKENPNVVKYFNSWIENDELYVVMEYCLSNLKQIKDSLFNFNEHQICGILKDVATGLKILHECDMVHLDIKPENILLSENEHYKIADFGLCRGKSLSNENMSEGDSRYLAYEVLNNFNENDIDMLKKADIFSLGISIYELMTGESLPLNGEEWLQLRFNSSRMLDSLPIFSPSLKSLIKKMMASNPAERPTISEILKSEFLLEKEERQLIENTRENFELRKKLRECEGGAKMRKKLSI